MEAGTTSKLIVAAIDFGTTYSGWGFSFKHEYDKDPTKVEAKIWSGGQLVSQKGPTCILLKQTETKLDVEAFGYEAESKYAELVDNGNHSNHYFFKRFKMMLFGKIGIERGIMLEDALGKKLPAMTVFSKSIWYLKNDLMKMATSRIAEGGLTEKDVHWVITVPAIWNDPAKQFMREAAKQARIPDDRLTIALEPEAASLFCKNIPVDKASKGSKSAMATLKAGTKYLVVDAGGGTVDVNVHEIQPDGKVLELHKASGGAWGGIYVDSAFTQFLIKLVGAPVWKKFQQECIEDFTDMFRDFEVKKRTIETEKPEKVTIRFPVALKEIFEEKTGENLKTAISQTAFAGKVELDRDKLRIHLSIAKEFFKATTDSIIMHLKDLTLIQSVKGCSCILMVGGSSESKILQSAVREAFPRMSVIVPSEPGLAVLKGAVIYGHSPTAIAGRICTYTYGIKGLRTFDEKEHPKSKLKIVDGIPKCIDAFGIYVRVGQCVLYEKSRYERTHYVQQADSRSVSLSVYISSDADPVFVTDPGCRKIGYLCVPLEDTTGGKDRKITVKMIFGGTEIEVECTEVNTGKVTKTRIDFLE